MCIKVDFFSGWNNENHVKNCCAYGNKIKQQITTTVIFGNNLKAGLQGKSIGSYSLRMSHLYCVMKNTKHKN